MSISLPSAIAQDAALDLLLAGIAGNSHDHFYEVRSHRRGAWRQEWFPVTDREDACVRILALALSDDPQDVYVGACPRTRHAGGKEAVEAGWCLIADLDTPGAVAAAQEFAPAPSVMVETSPRHAQAWWMLHEPVLPDDLKRANRRLAYYLGGDMACSDVARVMRVPGTVNLKYEPVARVFATVIEPTRCYTAREVVGGLPDPEPPRAPRPKVTHHDDPLKRIPAVEYVEVLTGVEVPRSGFISCPLHDERTPSFHVGGPDPTAWLCHGCQKGGGIYELAAYRMGFTVPLRDAEFRATREVLTTRFMGAGR